MSSAPTKSSPSASPAFDLDYSITDFEVDPHRDSQYLFARTEELMLREGLAVGGRTLDVACGVGRLAERIGELGGEGWGLEPSAEMLGLSRWLFPARRALLVRSVAEVLPFRDSSFDRIICQGSLDHFVDPHAFMREAARALRPGGRLIVALANYDSLSCLLGRVAQRLRERALGRPRLAHRAYWEPPSDHHHTGHLAFVRSLSGRHLALERCYGVSLLWLLRSGERWRWGAWLDRLPGALARALLVALDRIAYRAPALADMIVSVWRPLGTVQPTR